MAGGEGGSAKSDFIAKGSLIKHLIREEGGQKREKSSTSYMEGPLRILEKLDYVNR